MPFLLCDRVRFPSTLAPGLGRCTLRTHNNPLTCWALELWGLQEEWIGRKLDADVPNEVATGRSSAGEFLLVRVGGSRPGILVSLIKRDGVVEESEAPASWNVQFVGCEISCGQPLFYLQLASTLHRCDHCNGTPLNQFNESGASSNIGEGIAGSQLWSRLIL